MFKKEVRVILSEDAQRVYSYLNREAQNSKKEKSILNAINRKSQLIKENPQYGNPISKKLIPKKLVDKFGITNLFRVELPNFWRMLYTLQEGESTVEVISFVLEICDHKKYDKLFRY